MKIPKERLDAIRDTYMIVSLHIDNNDYKAATKQLYEVLDPKDYDLSLDIMYNYNKEFKYEKLRELILRVDEALCNYSEINMDEELKEDLFNGGIF